MSTGTQQSYIQAGQDTPRSFQTIQWAQQMQPNSNSPEGTGHEIDRDLRTCNCEQKRKCCRIASLT
ncbi:hypothetical protein PPTG_21192 [Phytophthora nicotianae INRA-310]|uniref:Uncharacterized protein n=1 Tax=Phytophthora nicotianae (strain INRA-310) TaxID=761204 RepID=W2R5X8_PHYN3|nr:hypothetical protein PPTG_21192 [Phytophthora nicotianae INRA-310]ETN19920.1 hypothetical protein PPTG_21192 [Phytophthora nicotianae INRA-310]